jgi:flagella basal body P-ring formation protein FlgA
MIETKSLMNKVMNIVPSCCRLLVWWLLALSSCVYAGVPQEKLFMDVGLWVAAQNNVSPEQVQIAPLDARIQVQACAGNITFDYPFTNKDSVRARCNKPIWQLFLKVSLARPQNTVVTTRPLAVGQIVTPADIELHPDFSPVAGNFSDRDAVIGRQLKRAVTKGQAILAQDLENTLQAFRLKQALRAGDVVSDDKVERVNLQRSAAGPSIWLGSALPFGVRLARDVQAGQIVQTTDLAESRQVLVAGTNLTAGQVLIPGQLKLERIEQELLTRTHLFDMRGLEGMELMRSIRTGEAIRTTDLRPALMIKKGDLVLFSVGRPSEFQVSVRLEAMQDGRLGEQIKLRNSDSGRTLVGIVTGQNAVRGM